MKAIVKTARGDGFVEMKEVDEPRVGEASALVRVRFAGICGSDIMILHDKFPSYEVPVIMGHEFAGTIELVGEGAKEFGEGERVVCETHASVCNECSFCRTGLYNLCPSRKGFGYGVDGAFCRLVNVRKGIIHRLPDEIDLKDAALLEPLSVVVNALTRNSHISGGDSVLVLGPGPIGLLSLQIARMSGGVVTVVGTERSRPRLAVASKLGADAMTSGELAEKISDGRLADRFDVVVIATGKTSSFETALRAARKNGAVVHVGESTDSASFQFSLIERKNLRVQGSFSHNWPVWETAISLLREGKVDVKPLESHEFPIERWHEAFDVVERGTGVKVLFKP